MHLSGFLGQACLTTITAALMSILCNKVAENKTMNSWDCSPCEFGYCIHPQPIQPQVAHKYLKAYTKESLLYQMLPCSVTVRVRLSKERGGLLKGNLKLAVLESLYHESAEADNVSGSLPKGRNLTHRKF